MDIASLHERLSALEHLFSVVMVDRCLKGDNPVEAAHSFIEAAEAHERDLLTAAQSDEQMLWAVGIAAATMSLADDIMGAVRAAVETEKAPRPPG
jgi:hypothetical protein